MRASHLEVLVEEESMARTVRHLLPRIVGDDVIYRVITGNGKSDLLRKLPNMLKGYAKWFAGAERILVLVDRDGDECLELKSRLEGFVEGAGLKLCRVADRRPGDVLNRVVVEELEAWFIADVEALRRVYPRVSPSLAERAGFRDPDSVHGTWEALEKVLQKAGYHKGGLPKICLADGVAPHLDLDNQKSHSFRAFVSGVRFLVEGAA